MWHVVQKAELGHEAVVNFTSISQSNLLICLHFVPEFPLSPPKITLETTCWNAAIPNAGGGRIELEIDWIQMATLRTIFTSVLQLLHDPEMAPTMDFVIERQSKENPIIFFETVTYWTGLFADGPGLNRRFERIANKFRAEMRGSISLNECCLACARSNWNVDAAGLLYGIELRLLRRRRGEAQEDGPPAPRMPRRCKCACHGGLILMMSL